ncbi:hypothetical protein PybrP1_008718 [[Pythium] brassicae (nom. inval.)]|nr:hypothetical protein PybrP1_008718 [[Pythium] brassicae (nom. inval.)]
MHRVSDHLNERHPYQDLPFKESYNPKEITKAFGSRAVPKFAELLIMDDLSDEDRVSALHELHELLSNQETKYTASTHEILFSCADLADSRSADVRQNAALVVASLVLFENDKVDGLSNDTMLRAATVLLSDSEELVVTAALTIFRNLTISNEGVLLVTKRDDVVEKLAAVIMTRPVKQITLPVLLLAVQVLANITRMFKGASVCMQFPIVAPVLEILKWSVLYSAEIILQAVLVISNAAVHGQGKREAIEMGAVELCLKVLSKVLLAQSIRCANDDAQVELVRTLVGAVMALSTSEDAKPRVVEFGVEPLVACLKHKDASVRKNAGIAVNSACESPLGAARFTRALLADAKLLVEVLGVKAISALNKSLSGADEDDKLSALVALAALMKCGEAEATAHGVVQCLGMIENIVALLADSQRDICQQASEALQRIVEVDEQPAKRVAKAMQKHGVSEGEFSRIMGASSLGGAN